MQKWEYEKRIINIETHEDIIALTMMLNKGWLLDGYALTVQVQRPLVEEEE